MSHASPTLRVALPASSLLRAGAEKQLVYVARALVEAGVAVRVFHFGNGGHYQSVLQKLRIPLSHLRGPMSPPTRLVQLIRLLRRFQPDIVLVNQFGDILYGAGAARFVDALIIGGVRSDGFYELNHHGWRSRWKLRLVHGLVANSYRARENLVSRGVAARRIEVVSNTIDLRDFDARAAQPAACSLPAGRVVLAAVGSLHACKRFDRFLDGLALARRREPALFGLLVGRDQGERAALERQAYGLRLLPDHLLVLGESGQVPALLAQTAGLVLCSEYEGFPNVILEAMAAGLPVLTAPVGDAGRLVEHGLTGLVIEGKDIQGLAEGMVRLARSPEWAAQMGCAGRRRVEEHYDFSSLLERLLPALAVFARQQQRSDLVTKLEQCLKSDHRNLKPEAVMRDA